jgi:hypothetical protein
VYLYFVYVSGFVYMFDSNHLSHHMSGYNRLYISACNFIYAEIF